MSRTKAFDWLSGTVTIPAHAPERWQEEGPHKGLIDFYENPNHHEWGGTLCRVLYHESIHFWQLLSSGYLANALQDEWLHLLEFEQTGNLRPTSNFVTGMLQVHTGRPFSVYELMESWARYWDVQTRSPATIVEEDQIQHDGIVLWTKEGCYTSHAFDLFMKEGKDAEFYARPYRWLLDQCEGHTRFANIAFPILVFHAFGSPRPIALLQRSLEYALKSDVVRKAALEGPAFINLDWPKNWPVFISEAIEPAARDLNMPNFTAGWDVIARGRLGSHPVYGAYRQLIRTMFSLSSLGKAEPPKKPSVQAAYEYAVVDLAARVPACVFAFPGEPVYRLALGEYVPPPRVRFNNFTLHATRNPVGKVNAALRALEDQTMRKDDFTFKSIFDEFDSRVRRFRHAEYAVSVGLPPTTFN